MTAPSAIAISLLRFRTGDLEFGIVAGAVERLADGENEAAYPHIAKLLGIAATSTPAEQRTLTLAAYGKRARLVIDSPIRITRIGAADLLPSGRALRRGRSPAVLGYAKEAEHIVLLLDVAWLVEKAC